MATYSESDGYSNALDPGFGKGQENTMWAGYYMGASTSLQPLEAMKDILRLPASGIQNVELSVIDPKQWESIPKEYFAEMRRSAQLAIKGRLQAGQPSLVSVHAPILEPTGFTQEGYSEDQWREAQSYMKDVVEKAAVLGTSTPIAIHASHFQSQSWRAAPDEANKELEKFNKQLQMAEQQFGRKAAEEMRKQHEIELDRWRSGEILDNMTAVDPATGKLQMFQKEEHVTPWGKEMQSPQERMAQRNHNMLEDEYQKNLIALEREMARAQMEVERARAEGNQPREQAWQNFLRGEMEDYNKLAVSTFDHIARADKNFMEKPEIKRAVEAIGQLPREQRGIAVADFIKNLGNTRETTPQLLRTVEDFGREKASEAFANMAVHSIKVATNPKAYGLDVKPVKPEQAPVVAIENVYPWAVGGRGDTLRNLIHDTREKFVQKAKAEMKLPEAEARKVADKIIGSTWDIAHINILRKFGHDTDAIMKEVDKIKKDIRHVQISDNFGFSDAHLAIGAGNVPIKEFMAKLEKEGDLKGIKSIVEAGAHFGAWKENPSHWTMKYMNTPIYGFQKSPTWGEQLGSYFMGTGGYSAGYGTILPPVHFSEYGSGFTALPTALGGQIQGQDRSKFGGTPMS
ncbi:MAG TPA: TIM barrel protein [Candidatus Nanoarchaeia archaeon]|nr:TIM barrel protein [Candidatus Nanoarchaeia archaeon]